MSTPKSQTSDSELRWYTRQEVLGIFPGSDLSGTCCVLQRHPQSLIEKCTQAEGAPSFPGKLWATVYMPDPEQAFVSGHERNGAKSQVHDSDENVAWSLPQFQWAGWGWSLWDLQRWHPSLSPSLTWSVTLFLTVYWNWVSVCLLCFNLCPNLGTGIYQDIRLFM
jgi:hypothetical protein